MYRIIASRSHLIAVGAAATLAIGLLGAAQASADGLNISTSYGRGLNGSTTKDYTIGTGAVSGVIGGSAGGGLGYSQTGYAAGVSGGGGMSGVMAGSVDGTKAGGGGRRRQRDSSHADHLRGQPILGHGGGRNGGRGSNTDGECDIGFGG